VKILGRTLWLGDPEATDIVIFDEEGSAFIKSAIDKRHKVQTYKMRPYEIYIGPKVLYYYFACINQLKISKMIGYPKGILLGLLNQLKCIYFESCLLAMSPKAVVTFIDNSRNFHWLSLNCRKVPFIAIQNGFRPRPHPNDSTDYSNYHLQHLICMGDHAAQSFPKMGYMVENYYPLGSLLSSLFFQQNENKADIQVDILIVSTWRGNSTWKSGVGYAKDVIDTMRSMRHMDHMLAKYIKERGLKAAVILRTERNSSDWYMHEVEMCESDYYASIYGGYVEIIETDFSKRNIYPLIEKSNLIVSCLCSALLEAFHIGKKVMYFNFTDSDWYYKDLPQSIVSEDYEYEDFVERMDNLFSAKIDEYRKEHEAERNLYIAKPTGKAVHVLMQETIDSIIGECAGSM
jgi:surface carbohydrate biosynthesis protein